MSKHRLRLLLALLLVPAMAVPAAAHLTGSAAAKVSPPVKADPLAVRDMGVVPGGRIFYDPVLGRSFVVNRGEALTVTTSSRAVPRPGIAGPESPGASSSTIADSSEPSTDDSTEESTDGSTGYDTRLAGHRRSVFYPSAENYSGPGEITTIAGGACDGQLGPQVATDPQGVVSDKAGRLFWLDHNDGMHLKGLPYIRTLDSAGRVRTLGNLGGPLTGRFWRDSGGSSGVIGLVPDQDGGVYYYFQGYLSGQWQEEWSDQGDDVPLATVVGHLDAAGRQTFISGRPLTGGQNNGYGTRSALPNGDGGDYADAAYYFIDAITADARGNLVVVDGNVPGYGTSASGASPSRVSRAKDTPQSHTDSRPVVVRYLNRSSSPVTFYAGTKSEITVAPGTIQSIAGSRTSTVVPVAPGSAAPVTARDAKFTFSSGVVTDPEGNLFLLQVGDGNVQVLAINTGSQSRRLYGVDVPPAGVSVVAGGLAGYGGDGGPGLKASFDVRDADHWFYGALTRRANGALLVTDTVNNRVRQIDPRGTVSTLIGTGSAAYNGDEKSGPQTSLNYPMGAAETPRGVVVADWENARLRVLGEDAKVRTLVGTGSASACGDGGDATGAGFLGGAGFGQPHDAVKDSAGNVYIADIALGVVRRIAPDGTVSTVVGTQFSCSSAPPFAQGIPACNPGMPSGDGGPPLKATLQGPSHLLLDRWNNLYISDGAQVRYVNFGKTAREVHGFTVAPNTIVTVLQLAAELRTVSVSSPFDGSTLLTYQVLVGVAGLALDESGTLYVADLKNSRVMALNWCGSLSVVAGNGTPAESSLGAGQGDGGPAVAASIAPAGLAWDGKRGLLFIASITESRVRAVNMRSVVVPTPTGELPAGFIQTFAGGAPCNGGGTCSYGDGGQAVEAALDGPTNVSVQPGGRLFVTDSSVNVVRVVEKDGTIGTLAGVAPEFYGGDIAHSLWNLSGECGDHGRSWRACLGGATAAHLTADGDLLIAESVAGRVRRIADAITAELRPLNLTAPVKGAGWAFTTPLRLRDQQGDNGETPSIAFDHLGNAYVIAGHRAYDGTPVGCDVWRYRSNLDGHGHDGYDFLGDPDAPLSVPLVSNAGTAGAGCSIAVSRGAGAPTSIPPGTGDRISFASESSIGLSSTKSYVQQVTAGSSRDGGDTFVSSPVAAITGALAPSSVQLAADGPDMNYMTLCCEYYSNNPPESTISIAASVGGQEYARLGIVATLDYPHRVQPNDHGFVGAPIVVGKSLVVPYYVNECTSSDVTVCQQVLPSDSRLYVARSTDGGKTFLDGAPVFSFPCTVRGPDGGNAGWAPDAWCQKYHGSPQVAADAGGTLHAVWDDAHHVYTSSSSDLGQHWTTPTRVDQGLSVSTFATIVAGDDGRVDIAWLGSTSNIKDPSAREAEWYVYLAQSLDANRPHPQFTQTLASDHRVHRGVLCQRGNGTQCFGNGAWGSEVGDWFRIAISPIDGRAVIAYAQDAGVVGQGTAAGIVATRQCDGPGLLLVSRPIPCEAGEFFKAPQSVPVACAPQGRDPQGDGQLAGVERPELDLTKLSVARDAKSVNIRIGLGAVPDLPPTGYTGEYWTAFWHYGRLDYYVQAASPAVQDSVTGSTMGFSYGLVNSKGSLSRLGTATGHVDGTGKNTTISWEVPADRVGQPTAHTVLSQLAARTDALSGATADSAALPTAKSTEVDVLRADFGYDPALACTAPAATAPAPGVALVSPPATRLAVHLPQPSPAPAPTVAPVPLSLPLATVGGELRSAANVSNTAPISTPITSVTGAKPSVLPALSVGPPTASAGTPRGVAGGRRAGIPARPPVEVPLLPCNRVPGPADSPPPRHQPPPPGTPDAVTPANPPQAAVAPPAEPPLTPVGPAPAPAPAPQPQPGPANQVQAQQQVSSQTQPGQQVGIAAMPEAAARESRAYAASRHSSPYPSVAYLWLLTFSLVAAGGGLASRQRRTRPVPARITGGR